MTIVDPEQLAYVARVRELAADHLLPLVEKGAEGRINRPLLAAMAVEESFTDDEMDEFLKESAELASVFTED
jgi:hypothetical protein